MRANNEPYFVLLHFAQVNPMIVKPREACFGDCLLVLVFSSNEVCERSPYFSPCKSERCALLFLLSMVPVVHRNPGNARAGTLVFSGKESCRLIPGLASISARPTAPGNRPAPDGRPAPGGNPIQGSNRSFERFGRGKGQGRGSESSWWVARATSGKVAVVP